LDPLLAPQPQRRRSPQRRRPPPGRRRSPAAAPAPAASCPSRRPLPPLLGRAGDDLLLQLRAEVAKVIAVPSHAHEQPAVLLGLGLGCAQGLGVDHVELHVVGVVAKVAPHEVGEVVDAFVACQDVGQELLVEQRAARAQVVHLGRGPQNHDWRSRLQRHVK
ncbi:MAG: hypothetical protein UX23_C0008G0049, partial [Parcubacteria group bacterium GW2011_GWB1_45_9]